MSDVLDLACELISRPSVTPDDAGCQRLVGERLRKAGFSVESLRFGEVDNLWATHGSGGPVLALLGLLRNGAPEVTSSASVKTWSVS
jgi:succinyl-diaminopimelate desuccinylase